MAINDLYKEATKNKVSSKKMAPEMTEADFISEHKRLIEVLKSGSRSELDAEYKLQKEELDECLGKKEEQGEPSDAEDYNEN